MKLIDFIAVLVLFAIFLTIGALTLSNSSDRSASFLFLGFLGGVVGYIVSAITARREMHRIRELVSESRNTTEEIRRDILSEVARQEQQIRHLIDEMRQEHLDDNSRPQ